MKKKVILFDWGNIIEVHTTGYLCYDAWNDLFEELYKNNTKSEISIKKN